MRKSGEPYVSHPIAVAEMVAEHIFRDHAIIAALLHDTVEDTTLTLCEIGVEFGSRVAQMVERLTRFVDPETGKKMSAGECLLKITKSKDVESMVVKIYDRIHNISTIEHMKAEKQNKIIQEIIEEFITLSEYLKINKISNALVSLCINLIQKIKSVNNLEKFKFSFNEYHILTPTYQNKISQMYNLL